jgi:hypothetical protein
MVTDPTQSQTGNYAGRLQGRKGLACRNQIEAATINEISSEYSKNGRLQRGERESSQGQPA